MKKYWICIFAALFMFSCDKISSFKKLNKNVELNNIIAAQLSKITNKFNVAEINSEKIFSLLVIKRNKPCAVLFYSNKSAPCIYSKKKFNDISKNSSNDILFVQINLADNAVKPLGTKYSVFSIPTLILFNHGKEFNRLVGLANIQSNKPFIIK